MHGAWYMGFHLYSCPFPQILREGLQRGAGQSPQESHPSAETARGGACGYGQHTVSQRQGEGGPCPFIFVCLKGTLGKCLGMDK